MEPFHLWLRNAVDIVDVHDGRRGRSSEGSSPSAPPLDTHPLMTSDVAPSASSSAPTIPIVGTSIPAVPSSSNCSGSYTEFPPTASSSLGASSSSSKIPIRVVELLVEQLTVAATTASTSGGAQLDMSQIYMKAVESAGGLKRKWVYGLGNKPSATLLATSSYLPTSHEELECMRAEARDEG